jgi:L-threonylcarbamoyladenylate synthase
LDLFAEGDIVSGRLVETLCARLRAGDVGILPTDTLYGLSGNALDARVVRRIARLKRRNRPATMVPPDVKWAQSLVAERHRARLPRLLRTGETLLVPFAPAAGALLPAAALTKGGYVGLRQPKHWIADIAKRAGIPLVTTSVNLSREPPMTSLDDLAPSMKDGVDLIVYAGPLERRASPIRKLGGARSERVVR